MNRLPMNKLTKAQFRILGDLIAYSVLNGIDPLTQRTMMDGRTAKGLSIKGYLRFDGIEDLNKQRVYTITEDGVKAYWKQKKA